MEDTAAANNDDPSIIRRDFADVATPTPLAEGILEPVKLERRAVTTEARSTVLQYTRLYKPEWTLPTDEQSSTVRRDSRASASSNASTYSTIPTRRHSSNVSHGNVREEQGSSFRDTRPPSFSIASTESAESRYSAYSTTPYDDNALGWRSYHGRDTRQEQITPRRRQSLDLLEDPGEDSG